MHRSKWIVGLGAVILGAALVTAQQQSGSASGQSGTSSSQQQAATPRRGGRLNRPWNQLSDLSDDQKTKIIAIHRKTLVEIAAINAKEREQVVALLTEDQKKQLATIDAQPRSRRGSTTRPAAGAAGN